MKRILLAALALIAFCAEAQDWPARTVRIIVPFPAGGSADLLPRVVAEKLSEKWGQPVIVENRPGAAGNIGADVVYRAEPDGYTLLSGPPPPLVINRLLYPKLTYDSSQFVPITVIGAIPNVLLVHPKTGVNTVQEFIALAKANPGRLNYASQGSGSTSHLTAELFKSMAGGLNITHVPYKGTAPALADLLAGQVEMMCDNLGVSLPHVKSGKLRALGVASTKRVPRCPTCRRSRKRCPASSRSPGSASWRRRRPPRRSRKRSLPASPTR
jgi:tripartite-type tricarboxylate transporter receptor subunit TctC